MSRTASTTSSTRSFMPAKPEPEAPKKAKRTWKMPRAVTHPSLTLVVIVVLAAASIFMFVQYRDAKAKLHTQSSSANVAAVTSVVQKVRKLVVLPANETPTVATVNDASKLQSQSFFAHAQDGDKVLVYNTEKEAILYRPSTNQIVTIAPVNVSNSTASQ